MTMRPFAPALMAGGLLVAATLPASAQDKRTRIRVHQDPNPYGWVPTEIGCPMVRCPDEVRSAGVLQGHVGAHTLTPPRLPHHAQAAQTDHTQGDHASPIPSPPRPSPGDVGWGDAERDSFASRNT
jgi:hypothetical protein